MSETNNPPGAYERPRVELLTTEEVGAILGVGAAAVRRLCLLQRIPSRKVGRRWRIPKAAFENWLGGDGRE